LSENFGKMKRISLLLVVVLIATSFAQEENKDAAKDAPKKSKTRTAKPGEDTRALALWEKHCSNGREGGPDGAFTIKCTHDVQPATDGENELVSNNGTLLGKITIMETYPLEIVFVQPPPPANETDADSEADEENGGAKKEIIVLVEPIKNGTNFANGTTEAPQVEEVKPEFILVPASSLLKPEGAEGGPSSTTTTTTPAPSEGRSSRDFWASLIGQQEEEEEPKEKVEEPEKLEKGQRKPKAFWPGAGNKKGEEQDDGAAPSTGSDDPDHVVLPHQGEKSISVPAQASGSLGFLRSFNPSGGKASEAKNKEDANPPRS
jgi:hypothetical protein